MSCCLSSALLLRLCILRSSASLNGLVIRDGEGANLPYMLNREFLLLDLPDFGGLPLNSNLPSGVSSLSASMGEEFSPPEEKSTSIFLGVVKDGARNGEADGVVACGAFEKKNGLLFGGANDGRCDLFGESNCEWVPSP